MSLAITESLVETAGKLFGSLPKLLCSAVRIGIKKVKPSSAASYISVELDQKSDYLTIKNLLGFSGDVRIPMHFGELTDLCTYSAEEPYLLVIQTKNKLENTQTFDFYDPQSKNVLINFCEYVYIKLAF